MVQMSFNAANYDPSSGGGDIFETGEYSFQIVKSEVRPTKKQDGMMLVFEAACLDEGFNSKRYTIRLNIQNPNPQAVEIAYANLSAICHVCGVMQLSDTQQLHGRPFRMRVEKSPRSDDPTKFTNDIRGFLDMNGNAPIKGQPAGGGGGAPGAPAAPPAAPPQPAAAPAAPPPAAMQQAPAAAPPAAAPAPEAAPPAAAPWQQQAAPAPGAAAAPAGVPPWQQG